MIITCKECNASFKLDESLLNPAGSKVRCSKCNEIFVAYPPKISEEAEASDEMAIDTVDQQITEDLEADEKKMTDPDELDLSDMDKLIDDEETLEDAVDEDSEDLDLDLNLDFDLDTEQAEEDLEATADQEESDELDLSDLENLLKEEEAISEPAEDKTIEDLDLKIVPESDAPMERTTPQDESEELDELDLSDLEDILDLEEPATEEESVADDIELELDMDTEPELEEISETSEAEDLEEVDLSEIEKMLEVEEEPEVKEKPVEEEPEVKEKPVEEELELDLEIEEAPAETTISEDQSQVEVFELDEAEDAVDEIEVTETAATEEMGPDFEVGEVEREEELEEEIAEEEPFVAGMTPAKKRVSKPLVALLILVLLAGGAYGTYVLLDFMNIEIPFISDYLKPKASDPSGSLKIDTLDVTSKFLLNVKEGKLFVITGRVKNGYSDARRFISINGRLYKKGKVLVQTEKAFCGNVLSDIELSNMNLQAIKKRLSNRAGDNKSNMLVKPGAELPFMIIFSNLPEDLEEFSIEVAGSISAG